MIVHYKPENGTEQSWDYQPTKVRQSEAEMIEKRAGCDWDAFNKNVLSGQARARKVLLWHCFRKDHPIYRWEDLPDFAMAEVSIEFDAKELVDIRAAVEKSTDISEDVRAGALEVLDSQIAALPDADPKAGVSSSDVSTGAL